MIRPGVLLAALGSLIFLWHECGEDLGVFCYRIGSGAFAGLRSRGLVPVPLRESHYFSAARNYPKCLTPSFTSSMRFTTRKD
jgi:hypothetical protein